MRRQSITNKLDNSDNTTILWAFFTHFDFGSVLSSNTHRWRANISYSYGVAESLFFYLISAVFSLLHDKHFETNEKISNRIDKSNTSIYNTIHRLVWWVGWIHFLVSRENCIWSPCFLFVTEWLILDNSGEATSWITFVCSLVCWD